MDTVFVAFVPEGPQHAKIGDLMRSYCRMLGSKKPLQLPQHITIANRFQTEAYEYFLDALRDACAGMKPFPLTLDGIGHFPTTNILFLRVKQDRQLTALHERVIQVVAAFKTQWIRPEFLAHPLVGPQQRYLERYNSPYVLEYYLPHLTLAGPDVDVGMFKEIAASPPKLPPMTFTVNALTIIRQTPDGWAPAATVPLGRK